MRGSLPVTRARISLAQSGLRSDIAFLKCLSLPPYRLSLKLPCLPPCRLSLKHPSQSHSPTDRCQLGWWVDGRPGSTWITTSSLAASLSKPTTSLLRRIGGSISNRRTGPVCRKGRAQRLNLPARSARSRMFGANRIAASTATTARFVCGRQLRSYHRLMLRRPHQTGANQL